MKCWELFPASCAGPPKKHQNGLPERFPGASRGLPGTSWKRRQERPKSRQDRPKSRPGALPERSWRPSGAQLPPRFLGARCSSLRGAIYEASAALSIAFREALSLASRPLESTAPEAKKNRKGPNQEPANTSESRHDKKMQKQRPRQQRRSKQPLATKRLANKRWSAVLAEP